MEAHQERVIAEKKELDEKLRKLKEFFDGKIFPSLSEEERDRLVRQHNYMNSYSNVLGERIAAF